MRPHAANPKLLENHVKNSADRDFYEAYRIASQYVQLAPEQAMQVAMMQTSDPAKTQTGSQVRINQVEEAVRDIQYGGGFFKGASLPTNQGYIASEIGRVGKFYAQNGMNTEDAIAEAKERFLATHTPVGGNYVYTAGKDIPPNFDKLATHAIEKYVEDFGEEEGIEAADLTIRPATNGYGWLIVHQMGQYPVEKSDRANLSLRSLYEMDRKRQEREKQAVIDQQGRNQKDRAAGIEPIDRIIPPMQGGLFSGDRAEAIRQRDEEDKKASGTTDDDSWNLPSIDTIFPPLKDGLFTGKRYDELNKDKP